MSAIAFDTLKYANTLKSAGVPSQQAEAQAYAMADDLSVNLGGLATKDDLKLLAADMREGFQKLSTRIDQVEQKLSAKIDQVEQKLSAEIRAVDQKLSAEIRAVDQKLSGEMKEADQKLNLKIDVNAAKANGEIVWMRWIGGVAIALMTTMLLRFFMIK